AKLFHPYENIGRGGWFPPPAWSPDGRWLAFVTEDVDPALRGAWVVDVDSGEEFFVGAGVRPIWSPDGKWLLVSPVREGLDDGSEVWLFEAGTWQPLMMFMPPGAVVVDWLR
ncbi:MAG TPA: hypothetical protein VLE70_11520, partial [Anaerolineae bacterium]|nr:hypothetical protein [Anaerolineae bacterium]